MKNKIYQLLKLTDDFREQHFILEQMEINHDGDPLNEKWDIGVRNTQLQKVEEVYQTIKDLKL